jgi:hypothetical protein
MTAAELIQILVKEGNIDKDVVISDARYPSATYDIEQAQDHSSVVNILVDLENAQECGREHATDDTCTCDCDLCRHCEWK